MSMYKCPVCGELFSTSYKKCPFCEEDDLLMDRRKTTSRRSRRNEPRAVGPLLIVIFLMLVALVVFLVKGDSLFGGDDKPVDEDPPVIETPIEDEEPPVVEEPEPEPEPEKKPMTLDKTSVELNGGESITLVASDGSGNYAWTSDNEDIVKVEDGVLTTVGGGTTTIIVSDGETELTCTVTVHVVELTIKNPDVSVAVGDSFNLKKRCSGGETFTFCSKNESIAVVSEDGIVTAKSKGKVNIVVSNGGDTKSCIVRVK